MIDMLKTTISENYARVRDRILQAAQFGGRNPADIQLVVVTKGHALEAVQAVIAAGARRIGENYVEEALPKILSLAAETEVEWHMIGHVQSRKAPLVASNFMLVHSVDRLKLAQRLNLYSGQLNRKLSVLLECNVSGEESKFGLPAWHEERWLDLLPIVEEIVLLPNLQVNGLMTMAPYLQNPQETRLYFRRLSQLREFITRQLPQTHLTELSMGMSADFEVAVQEGATLLRIGTAIMGERP